MRPPEFTGGNAEVERITGTPRVIASMRPPEFTGGNRPGVPSARRRAMRRFNEAAGIHRRKRLRPCRGCLHADASMRPPEFTGGNQAVKNGATGVARVASMRPPEFTGGNNRSPDAAHGHTRSFNEAAGIHRRKRCRGVRRGNVGDPGFNEAAGIHRRKRAGAAVRVPAEAIASMRPPEFTGGNA